MEGAKMTYTVWYRKNIFWKRVRNVEADDAYETDKGALPVRVLYLANKTRLEIPMSCLIKFSRERHDDIQALAEKLRAENVEGG
jgi:hypothetical protein